MKSAIAASAFPTIVPSSVFGEEAPSNKLQIALIGCGRIGASMDINGLVANQDLAVLTTVCDCDNVRLKNMKSVAERRFGKKMDHLKYEMDYRKVLDDPGIDGVMICTQDHWHARMAVEACYKGKDVYVQKPMAISIEESEAIVEAVRKTKRVFHIGTQQRSNCKDGLGFVKGVEYVRSGRLGKLSRIDLGIIDNSPKKEWPLPLYERTPDKKDFDFDLWLGPARDDVRFSQLRTHWRPVDSNGKQYAKIPGQNVGWLQIKDYCTGNISGWGSHHIDIAQWAMDNAGPVSVKCDEVKFLSGRLFNVHDDCRITYKYGNGVELKLGTPRLTGYRCGVQFFGENGDWISTCRWTTAIPEEKRVDTAYKAKADFWRVCEANRKELITGEPEVKVIRNPLQHHRPWFLGMRSRKDTNITVEEANTSTISCILGYHAMNEQGRTIGWDPIKRQFTDPSDQKRLYSGFARPQFAVAPILREIRKKFGA
jgi:predicted dehydrogenase